MIEKYIKETSAIEAAKSCTDAWEKFEVDVTVEAVIKKLKKIPAADVVTRDAFNRILAENDDMRKQLAEIGKKPGDEMSDVRRIRNDRWVLDSDPGEPWRYSCPVCGEKCKETVMGQPRWNYCPMCGTLLENNL